MDHREEDVIMPEAEAVDSEMFPGPAESRPSPRKNLHLNRKRPALATTDGEPDENPLRFSKQIRLEEKLLPQAPTLEDYIADPEGYRARADWLTVTTESSTAHFRLMQRVSQDSAIPSLPLAKTSFGTDKDSALHYCIRHAHYAAAKKLILEGAVVDVENIKGVTPLIVAAQKGRLDLVELLESNGANESHVTISGSTAALQAAHFGRLDILRHLLRKNRQLLEMANYHHTTPLMRASQEGHLHVVKYLCEMGATVNRKNMQAMTALMLASQRGNADVCEYLIQKGADLNAMTQQASTSLVLACKRQHLQTVEVLVRSGAELFIKDSRNRTAKDITLHRHGGNSHRNRNEQNASTPEKIQKLTWLLDATVQVDLMRLQARKNRSWALIRTWTLLQQDRARLRGAEDMPFHEAIDVVQSRRSFTPSAMAWIRTMSLPPPLVRLIAEFAPVPSILDRRCTLLIGRCSADPNEALASCFDLIDEVLEESGFLEVCDKALIPAPESFSSWIRWKRYRLRNSRIGASSGVPTFQSAQNQPIRPNATLAQLRRPQDPTALVQHRRYAGYLQMLAKHFDRLEPILTSPPYGLRPIVVQQLATISDICSIVRRFGFHRSCGAFSSHVALDVILFASRLCGWYVGDT